MATFPNAPTAGTMNPYQLLMLAYIQQQMQRQQQQQGNPVSGLANLAKESGVIEAGKDLLGLSGSGAAATSGTFGGLSAGTPVASHMGGTMLASGEVVPMSMAPEVATDITNFAGSATPYLGAAGTALGAYNAYKGIEGKNPMRAGLGGAGAALGLNAMGYALGPYGWAAMVAAPAVGALVNKMGDKDRWKTEGKRLAKLREQGINIPQMEADSLTGGRSKQQLIDAELAKQAKGQYSNVDFARTRDEKFLKPEDIWGYATFAEKYGNDWFGKFSEQQRREIAQKALSSGAVREHHGTIDVDWGKVDAAPQTATPTTNAGPARSTPLQINKPGSSQIPVANPLNLRPIADQDRGRYGIDARDPNKYGVDPEGRVVGTAIGWNQSTTPPTRDMIAAVANSSSKPSYTNFRGGNRNMIPRRA
jgi:hypothetical protein